MLPKDTPDIDNRICKKKNTIGLKDLRNYLIYNVDNPIINFIDLKFDR